MVNTPDLAETLALQLRAQLGNFTPRVGLILGSGLGALVAAIKVHLRISYADCPGLFVSTIHGHKGELVFGTLSGIPLMCMNGRVHLYEGATCLQILTPIRMMKILGCKSLIVTNAAGSLKPAWTPGTIVAIKDQINMTGISVLAGPNAEQYGPRFLAMEYAYDPKLRHLFHLAAQEQQLQLEEGVYLGVMGPCYETPAEIKLYSLLGGDMVGMSTIHEVIAAHHAGLKVAGLSLITNLGAGLGHSRVNHEEVLAMAKLAGQRLQNLIVYVLQHYIPIVLENTDF